MAKGLSSVVFSAKLGTKTCIWGRVPVLGWHVITTMISAIYVLSDPTTR